MLKKIISNLFGSKAAIPEPTNDEIVEDQESVVTTPAEVLCGVDPTSQTTEVIKQRLAVLYKRHNSAVSSLNPQLRDEAKQMLEAIAECRAKYVDES